MLRLFARLPSLFLPCRLLPSLLLTCLLPASLGPLARPARATPLLSCVEPVWCDIAQQIGGPALRTHALINSEGLDPHHLQPSPLMARQLADSDAVLLNGATYDDWAARLLPTDTKRFIAADNASWQAGEDPHLFFDLPTIRKTARQIAAWLANTTPQAKPAITARLAVLEGQIDQLSTRLSRIDQQEHGASFAMTEPAGERLLLAAGLHLTDQGWARSLMNETGLSPRETAALESSIQQRHIRLLVRNPNITAPQARMVETMAETAGIPVIAIGESLPTGQHWQDWLNGRLDALETTLKQSAPLPSSTSSRPAPQGPLQAPSQARQALRP